MNRQLRYQRTVFFLFLGACLIALLAGLPIVKASLAGSYAVAQAQKKALESAAGGSSAPSAPERPSFDQTDRNKDGYVDKSEAGVVQGLSANFERADRNKDGMLDKAEFEKGIEILQARR